MGTRKQWKRLGDGSYLNSGKSVNLFLPHLVKTFCGQPSVKKTCAGHRVLTERLGRGLFQRVGPKQVEEELVVRGGSGGRSI